MPRKIAQNRVRFSSFFFFSLDGEKFHQIFQRNGKRFIVARYDVARLDAFSRDENYYASKSISPCS